MSQGGADEPREAPPRPTRTCPRCGTEFPLGEQLRGEDIVDDETTEFRISGKVHEYRPGIRADIGELHRHRAWGQAPKLDRVDGGLKP